MPNAIKFSASQVSNAIKKGNFAVANRRDIGYGDTNTSGFWNGIDPPPGGYVVYFNKASQGPAIFVLASDSELITFAKRFSSSISTITAAIQYFATLDNCLISNKNTEELTTDSLVLYLDSSFTSSYPKGGATWFDISGSGNNTTLINEPSFDSTTNTVSYDAVNDGATSTYSGALSNYTVIIVFRSVNTPAYGRLVDKNYTNGFWYGNQEGLANKWGGGPIQPTYPHGVFLTLADGNWHHFVARRSGTTHTLYGNGLTNTVSHTVSASATNTTNVGVGSWYDNSGGQRFGGLISRVMIYNRALTDAEILRDFYGGGIVTSNLKLALDSGNLVSYPKSGSIWTDMSDVSRTFNLTNGPTFNIDSDSILFDGSNDYVDFSFSLGSATTVTVEMWVKIGAAYSGKMFFGFLYYDVWCGGANLGYNTAGGDVYGISAAAVSQLGLVDNWKHYVFEMRSDVSYTNNKIYINGVSQTLSQQLGGENSDARNFNSGNGRISSWKADTGYCMPMNCAIFRVYDRALTQAEITQNFNTQRSRFRI
jgi:hypothetical protein